MRSRFFYENDVCVNLSTPLDPPLGNMFARTLNVNGPVETRTIFKTSAHFTKNDFLGCIFSRGQNKNGDIEHERVHTFLHHGAREQGTTRTIHCPRIQGVLDWTSDATRACLYKCIDATVTLSNSVCFRLGKVCCHSCEPKELSCYFM